MRAIWETDRWFTFPKFEETAKNVAAIMRRAGLEDVEIGNPPADGVIAGRLLDDAAGVGRQSRHARNRRSRSARRSARAGRLPEGPRVYRHVERSDAGRRRRLRKWCFAPANLENVDVKGKLVLGQRDSKTALARAGALGMISENTENPRSGRRARLGEFVRRQRLELHQGQRAAGVLFDHAARVAACP